MLKREPRFSGLTAAGKMPPQVLLVVILTVVCITFAILAPGFATGGNILNVLRQSSTLFMLACGQTLILLLAGIDLSQGSVVGLVSVLTGLALIRFGTGAGILIGLSTGAVTGLVSGLVITKAKVQPFIVSLGMLFTIEGITFIISREPISGLPESFFVIGGGMIGPIPVPVILVAVVAVIFHLLLKQTPFGRNIYAIGGNEEAVRLAGIGLDRVKNLVWVLNGLLVALGSIILTSRVQSGQPLAGGGLLLESIGAAVIGGTSLFGGRGGVIQAVMGALFIAFLVNGLNIMGISTFVKDALIGALIILAVWFGFRGRKS
jgi:ribose/xylose/arabinose/galactoside ABC-type transport system permease subunit